MYAVHLVHHISCESELFMMTCPGMCAVQVTCLAVAAVERGIAQSFAYARRHGVAFQTLCSQLDSCCKMSSTYRQLSVTIV